MNFFHGSAQVLNPLKDESGRQSCCWTKCYNKIEALNQSIITWKLKFFFGLKLLAWKRAENAGWRGSTKRCNKKKNTGGISTGGHSSRGRAKVIEAFSRDDIQS